MIPLKNAILTYQEDLGSRLHKLRLGNVQKGNFCVRLVLPAPSLFPACMQTDRETKANSAASRLMEQDSKTKNGV